MITVDKAVKFGAADDSMVRVYANMSWKDYCKFQTWLKKENENGEKSVDSSIREIQG